MSNSYIEYNKKKQTIRHYYIYIYTLDSNPSIECLFFLCLEKSKTDTKQTFRHKIDTRIKLFFYFVIYNKRKDYD